MGPTGLSTRRMPAAVTSPMPPALESLIVRIGVVGAGAIGGTFAALLDRAGHEVVVTARGDHLDAIRERGLQLRGAWGDHLARIGAAQALPEPPSWR